ncbi:hypothetical protein PN836_008605 [Ningiella sp. W23]|uniref:hypothetical protein n=1 Tax=Ningiella sp. W23 TaxID=3023715 RepID=UPI003757A6DA
MILKQNIPYAALIYSALDLCDIMLRHCSIVYPFAVISIDNDVQSIFSSDSNQYAHTGMIEELEKRLCEHRLVAESAVSVLVYVATVSDEDKADDFSDAIVFNITDNNGNNTITLYPYTSERDKIKLGSPFTCNFSD